MENLGDGDRSVTVETVLGVQEVQRRGPAIPGFAGQITRPRRSFAPLSRVDATVLARVLEAMAQGLPE